MQKKISISRCVPNSWNPNVMSQHRFAKLEASLKATLGESENLPPIVVRRIGSGEDFKYEIIDGYHRWKALKKMGIKKIDAAIIQVDDKTAQKLTINLNWLRGEADPKKYVSVLSSLITLGESVSSLANELPESEQELQDLIDTYGDEDVQWKAFREASKEFDEDVRKVADSDDNILVELRFNVSKVQADSILKELYRIGDTLNGSNLEGRALERMASNSQLFFTKQETYISDLRSNKKKGVARES